MKQKKFSLEQTPLTSRDAWIDYSLVVYYYSEDEMYMRLE